MTNIFLEKSYPKCGGKASPRLLYKKSKLSYLWNLENTPSSKTQAFTKSTNMDIWLIGTLNEQE